MARLVHHDFVENVLELIALLFQMRLSNLGSGGNIIYNVIEQGQILK